MPSNGDIPEKEAKDESLTHIQKKLVNYVINRYGKSREDAEDYVSNSIVKYLEKENYKGSLKAFLYNRIHWDILSDYEKEKSHIQKLTNIKPIGVATFNKTFSEDVIEGIPDGISADISPCDEILQAEENKLVKDTLGKISPRSAAIITMRLYDGLLHKEIAYRFNLTEDKIKQLWKEALQEFKRFYKRKDKDK